MTIFHLKRSFLRAPKRRVAPPAREFPLASFTGSALVERLEKQAAEDRLSFGTMAYTCVRASCKPSHFLLE